MALPKASDGRMPTSSFSFTRTPEKSIPVVVAETGVAGEISNAKGLSMMCSPLRVIESCFWPLLVDEKETSKAFLSWS